MCVCVCVCEVGVAGNIFRVFKACPTTRHKIIYDLSLIVYLELDLCRLESTNDKNRHAHAHSRLKSIFVSIPCAF